MVENNCGCKASRSCLMCEQHLGLTAKNYTKELQGWRPSFVYCRRCVHRAWEGWDVTFTDDTHISYHQHLNTSTASLEVSGIRVQEDFITVDEEHFLKDSIEKLAWVESQSGRWKQDFGPKVNFKKGKVRVDAFKGFPRFVQFVLERLRTLEELGDFRPVELCHLQYDPSRGSSIDPHLDDSWLWGPRLVTLNLGSSTVLTLLSVGATEESTVRILMEPRSLIVLFGDARHRWPHAIFREDVHGVRWAMTFRELSANFLTGGEFEDIGRQLLERAKWILD